ncbi:MAG: hypothetical protein GX195_09465 [Firmicutes bacterium]|jgi:multicomponent Na+:H+ antiporter subunit C|nr:hypothetical protein [Bacillota bacterium]
MDNLFYLLTTILFLIGLWIVLSHGNLVKKIMGITIMKSAVFLCILASGFVHSQRGIPNPMPARIVIAGLVVTTAVTAVALALVAELARYYGTADINEITRLRRMGQ